MTYIEMILLLEGRGEKTLSQDISSLITNKHRFLRSQEGWSEDMVPGFPESRQAKGGTVWIWKNKETHNV